jgi:hypothetical protein
VTTESAGTPPTEGKTETVRMPVTIGTPATPGTQAEVGSVDRRRTDRAGYMKHKRVTRKLTKPCYKNEKLIYKKTENLQSWEA